jgi:tetratricopeptide (TPR) repeat protein
MTKEQTMENAQRLYDLARNAATLEEAIPLYQQSAEIYPHFKTLELLGEALLNVKKIKESIIPLAAATTLNRQVRAPSLLAEALLELGEREKAREAAMIALERDKTNKRALKVMKETSDIAE